MHPNASQGCFARGFTPFRSVVVAAILAAATQASATEISGGLAALASVPVDTVYDFSKGPLGWTPTNASYNGKPISNTWFWANGLWQVDSATVTSPSFWTGNYLTSPAIEVAATIDTLEVTMIHRFALPNDGIVYNGVTLPVDAGQLSYRIVDAAHPNAAFQPFPRSAFASGTVPAPTKALTPFPDWVTPTFVSGVPPVVSLPPLLDAGASWVGESPFHDFEIFVASRVTLQNLVAGQQVQFRLTNANLDTACSNGGWDVSSVTVNGFAPEPSGVAIAAAGIGLAAIARGRLRRQVTTAPRGRA